LAAVDAKKLTTTSRRLPHKSRQETQSTAAFLKPSTASSGVTAASSDVRQNGKRKVQKHLPLRSCTDQHELARICTVTSICAYLTVYGLNLCRFLDEEAASLDFV
jgi:hypothetical protein